MPLDHRFFAVVRAAQAMPVADTAALQRSTSPREAMEARLLVEPELAGLATINATYEQIAAIRALAEQTRSSQSWSLYEENDLRLHHLIVEASGNKLLVSVHEVVNCCSPRTIGHGQGFPRAAMNSRGERYPRALCGCTSL
jgi:DNA-binding FadR family transcriptional regulator